MRKSAYTVKISQDRSRENMRTAQQRAPPKKAEGEVNNMTKSQNEAAERLRRLVNENYEPGSMAVDLRYRKKEQPTGEEVKFNRFLILNRVKTESATVQKQLKITAVLTLVSTAAILAAILAAVCYLK
jgi:hypothetical protein